VSGDQNEAVDAFEQLGLTSYEAKVFIALHRLGAGTARDVAEITDVPRSQVYSVAESLENRGPARGPAVEPDPVPAGQRRRGAGHPPDPVRARTGPGLRVRRNRQERADWRGTQEDIWTVRGRNRVDDRTADILSQAEGRIVFGTRLPELVTDSIERAIAELRGGRCRGTRRQSNESGS